MKGAYTMVLNKDFKVNVDWLNVRVDVPDPFDFFEAFSDVFNLADDELQPRSNGVAFYDCCFYIPSAGYSSVTFSYNNDDDGNFISDFSFGRPYGLLVSISGDGCRYLNSLIPNGMYEFIKLCNQWNCHCTRIDIACDFLSPDNKVVPLIQDFAMGYYTDRTIGLACNLRDDNLVKIDLNYDKKAGELLPNVTIGTRGSKKGQLQLYNKRVEMETGRLSDIAEQYYKDYGVTDYWWRMEYRCKSFAPVVFANIIENGLMAGLLQAMQSFGRFYVYTYGQSGYKDNEDWQDFYDFIAKNVIHLVELVNQPYVKPSVISTLKWAEHNASLLYRLSLIMLQSPDYLHDILLKGEIKHKTNPRYRPFDDDFSNYQMKGVEVNV